MRTTITLDPDVQAGAEALRRNGSVSLSQAINSLARAGLGRQGDDAAPVFRQRTQAIGLQVDVSNVAEALDLLDEVDHS